MRSRIFSTLIISSLLTVGVFGFLGLGFVDHGGQHTCPISLISGGDCSSIGGVALAFHHVSGIQNLTQSMIGFSASSLVLSIFFVFALLVVSKLLQRSPVLQLSSHKVYYRTAGSNFIPKKQFLRWLAIHHKRDPYSYSMGV